jgi:hypothetical protein
MPSGVLLAGALLAAIVAVTAARRVHRLWTQDRAHGMGDREVADNLRPRRTSSNYSVRVPPSPRNGDRRGH